MATTEITIWVIFCLTLIYTFPPADSCCLTRPIYRGVYRGGKAVARGVKGLLKPTKSNQDYPDGQISPDAYASPPIGPTGRKRLLKGAGIRPTPATDRDFDGLDDYAQDFSDDSAAGMGNPHGPGKMGPMLASDRELDDSSDIGGAKPEMPGGTLKSIRVRAKIPLPASGQGDTPTKMKISLKGPIGASGAINGGLGGSNGCTEISCKIKMPRDSDSGGKSGKLTVSMKMPIQANVGSKYGPGASDDDDDCAKNPFSINCQIKMNSMSKNGKMSVSVPGKLKMAMGPGGSDMDEYCTKYPFSATCKVKLGHRKPAHGESDETDSDSSENNVGRTPTNENSASNGEVDSEESSVDTDGLKGRTPANHDSTMPPGDATDRELDDPDDDEDSPGRIAPPHHIQTGHYDGHASGSSLSGTDHGAWPVSTISDKVTATAACQMERVKRIFKKGKRKAVEYSYIVKGVLLCGEEPDQGAVITMVTHSKRLFRRKITMGKIKLLKKDDDYDVDVSFNSFHVDDQGAFCFRGIATMTMKFEPFLYIHTRCGLPEDKKKYRRIKKPLPLYPVNTGQPYFLGIYNLDARFLGEDKVNNF